MYRWKTAFVCPVIVALVSACALTPTDLVDDGILEIETESPQKIWLHRVAVHQDDSSILVSGEARFWKWAGHGIFSGHIDVAFQMPDGRLQKKIGIPVTPRSYPYGHGWRATFSSRLNFIPPTGTTALIIYHDGNHFS